MLRIRSIVQQLTLVTVAALVAVVVVTAHDCIFLSKYTLIMVFGQLQNVEPSHKFCCKHNPLNVSTHSRSILYTYIFLMKLRRQYRQRNPCRKFGITCIPNQGTGPYASYLLHINLNECQHKQQCNRYWNLRERERDRVIVESLSSLVLLEQCIRIHCGSVHCSGLHCEMRMQMANGQQDEA